jgi:hypothetical protein
MFLVLHLHLLALLAGLLVYELVHLLAPRVQKRLTNKGSRLVALAALSVLALSFSPFDLRKAFKSDTGNLQAPWTRCSISLPMRAPGRPDR